MIRDINFEHETFVANDLSGRSHLPQRMSSGIVSINVSMVFSGHEIALAIQEAATMEEAVGLFHIASAVARRDNVFISDSVTPGAVVSEPTPAPAQRQPTGKRNMDLG